MTDLADGETREVKGSGSSIYTLKNSGGAYSCTCPAWRNQSTPAHKRTCKHLKALRGEAVELTRLGQVEAAAAAAAKPPSADGEEPAAQPPPLLLAHSWENDVALEGWWMSEKLDGVRAYWDGKSLISRLGNPFPAPDWFLAQLPEHPLDGELWLARKQFQRAVGIVRRQDRGPQWKEIAYLVFDAPGLDAPFEERLAFVRSELEKRKPPHARPHEHERCKGLDHLRAELSRVEALGGEGLMLRKPGSRYEVGRSSTLLKVKTFHDAEARVLAYQDGEGRHKGRVGALLVEMPDGKRFAVGTGLSDAERTKPPALGTVITYRYQELSDAGIPRFPSYVGERADAEWPPKSQPKASAPAAAALTSAKVEPTPPSAKEQEKKPDPTPAAPAKPAAPSAPAAKAAEVEGTQRFELGTGPGAMFWEISLENESYLERWGTVGTNGRTRKRKCADPSIAKSEAEKLVAEKRSVGYLPRNSS